MRQLKLHVVELQYWLSHIDVFSLVALSTYWHINSWGSMENSILAIKGSSDPIYPRLQISKVKGSDKTYQWGESEIAVM